MIKMYITAIESRDDGTAIKMFEDYEVRFEDKYGIMLAENLNEQLFNKIEEVESINEAQSKPF